MIVPKKRFTQRTKKDNILFVDEAISSKKTDLGFDLTIVADNFQALNSKEKDTMICFMAKCIGTLINYL
jgi:hypothetical protein